MSVQIAKVIVDNIIDTIEATVPDDPATRETFVHADNGTAFRDFWFDWPRGVTWAVALKPRERHPRDIVKALDLLIVYPFTSGQLEYVAGVAEDDATRLAHVLETGWASWNDPSAPFVLQGLQMTLQAIESPSEGVIRSHYLIKVYYNRDQSY